MKYTLTVWEIKTLVNIAMNKRTHSTIIDVRTVDRAYRYLTSVIPPEPAPFTPVPDPMFVEPEGFKELSEDEQKVLTDKHVEIVKEQKEIEKTRWLEYLELAKAYADTEVEVDLDSSIHIYVKSKFSNHRQFPIQNAELRTKLIVLGKKLNIISDKVV